MSRPPTRNLKTPAFLRREGRRKRKAGAKNEKAIIIIAVSPKTSIKIRRNRSFFPKLVVFG
jgi:hypothetical protein